MKSGMLTKDAQKGIPAGGVYARNAASQTFAYCY